MNTLLENAQAAKKRYESELDRLSTKSKKEERTREVIIRRLPGKVQERIQFNLVLVELSEEELSDAIRFLNEATDMMMRHSDWHSFRIEYYNTYGGIMQTDLFCDNSGIKPRVKT